MPTLVPRSGCTQQPGVAAQRRTPGNRSMIASYAAGVLQPPSSQTTINPTHTAHQTRHRTCETTAAARPEMILCGDALSDFGYTRTIRRRVMDSRRMLRSPAATESAVSLPPAPSAISTIPVSVHERGQRSRASWKADRECERGLRLRRLESMENSDYGRFQRGNRASLSAQVRSAETVGGLWWRKQHADSPVRVTGPCLSFRVAGSRNNACRTPSAYDSSILFFLGWRSAAAPLRLPQANGYNRFAVLRGGACCG